MDTTNGKPGEIGLRGKLGLGFAALLSRAVREIKRGNLVLLRARKVSQAAIDQLPEAVAVFSDRGDIELVNATAELIKAAADEFRAGFEWHGVGLAVAAAPDIPRVLADPARIKMVLGFLLDNALANTPPGGSVSLRAEAGDGRVRFTVADDGRGIPKKHQERIFERFYQVPGSEDRGRAGLGLSTARDVVQSHGGEIRLESAEGSGTVVWFTLPAARLARKLRSRKAWTSTPPGPCWRAS